MNSDASTGAGEGLEKRDQDELDGTEGKVIR